MNTLKFHKFLPALDLYSIPGTHVVWTNVLTWWWAQSQALDGHHSDTASHPQSDSPHPAGWQGVSCPTVVLSTSRGGWPPGVLTLILDELPARGLSGEGPVGMGVSGLPGMWWWEPSLVGGPLARSLSVPTFTSWAVAPPLDPSPWLLLNLLSACITPSTHHIREPCISGLEARLGVSGAYMRGLLPELSWRLHDQEGSTSFGSHACAAPPPSPPPRLLLPPPLVPSSPAPRPPPPHLTQILHLSLPHIGTAESFRKSF